MMKFIKEKFFIFINFFQILGCKVLDVPLIVTEQYPKGLGSTVSDLPIDHAKCVAPKTKFSMIVPEVEAQIKPLQDNGLQSIILCGIEVLFLSILYFFINLLAYKNKP